VTRFFVRPERYTSLTIHAAGPLAFFDEPIRAQLYAKVLRNGPDLDGRIDYDQPGRLSGNWFLDSLPVVDTENFANGPMHLAFIRDKTDPTVVVISIGGTIGMVGGFFVGDGPLDPANVTPSTGAIAYRLFTDPLRRGSGDGLLRVQMLADDRIRVQAFPGTPPASQDFTADARTYIR